MTYRQSPQPQQGGRSGGSMSRPTHGSQCPCAVCTDLNSMAESVPSQRHRQGGSLASTSYISGHTAASQSPALGEAASESTGRRSESIRSAPPRRLTTDRQSEYLEDSRPTKPSRDQRSAPAQGREDRPPPPRESSQPDPNRIYECVPADQHPDQRTDQRLGQRTDQHPDQRPGQRPDQRPEQRPDRRSERESEQRPERERERRPEQRPKSAAKSKPKKTPSATRSKAGKASSPNASAPSRGGQAQAPRPLCVSSGRSDKAMSFEDECDLDDLEEETEVPEMGEQVCPFMAREQVGPAMAGEPATGEQPYDRTVAEKCGLQAAPLVSGTSAAGKPDWSSLVGPTGTCPIFDGLSICKRSEAEWRQRNLETFERAAGDTSRASAIAFNARGVMSEVLTAASKSQGEVTQRLQMRNAEVRQWVFDVKKSREELWNEIKSFSSEDDRLRRVICVLEDIIQLVGESIQLRNTRTEPDRTCDDVNTELNKELALVHEIKQLLQRTRDEIRKLLDSSRAAKLRLEHDISDKESAVGIDCGAINLRVDSPTILFYKDAGRLSENQTTPETWEILSRENLSISQTEISKMHSLRAIIDRVARDSSQSLLTQKAKTEDAIIKHITEISSIIEDLEDRLRWILKRIPETEKLIQEIKETVRKLDFPLKKAQTRLKVRQDRLRNENTDDCPQNALFDEMKTIEEQYSVLMEQLASAEEMLADLCKTRSYLERELQMKKRTLFIDRDRILRYRQDYPPTEALTTTTFSKCLPCV